MERAAGIDPASPVWKTGYIRLYQTRVAESRGHDPHAREGTARLAGGSRPCRDNSPY
jgi:hypothetical protein